MINCIMFLVLRHVAINCDAILLCLNQLIYILLLVMCRLNCNWQKIPSSKWFVLFFYEELQQFLIHNIYLGMLHLMINMIYSIDKYASYHHSNYYKYLIAIRFVLLVNMHCTLSILVLPNKPKASRPNVLCNTEKTLGSL